MANIFANFVGFARTLASARQYYQIFLKKT